MRFHIVALPNVAAKMNEAAKEVDTVGGDVLTVGLATAANPTTVVAYWASWDFAATEHDPQQLRTWMKNKGATNAETTPVANDANSNDTRQQRVAFFNAEDWTNEQVLDHLGLVRLDTEETP